MLPSVFGKKNPLMHRYEHVKSAVSIIWYQSKRIIAHVILYILARAYLEKYPQMASSWIIAPWNLSEMMHQLAFGCLVYSTLQLPSIPYTMFVALAFKTPCIPMFIRPYFSTSLREFWSYRWNNHFQSSFKKTVFLPV
ncbi:hypothetical protein BCR33DRAFT_849822 [Rhizoclosmatium globosum]|uniref:Wax synthase domain-containing protein n=1 Tax=Rhizoclosmatium globosum TaxID=329046 RepID=A0A1Y2CF94_9FUNG|nr:hypothetical protein BCR33DRAFT_849822 [Rhizoclosmatium globosum]|eukprot:ORY45567.1 hypothetical protein BCR33DRAFT_849822 [Rhizoclosmatium globosum]